MKLITNPPISIRRLRQQHKPKGPVILHPYFLLIIIIAVALCSVTVMGKLLVSLEKRYITKLSELLRGDVTLVECNVTTPHDTNVTTAANGVLEITVRNDIMPIASRVFIDLIQANYYDGVYIFRVIPGFIAQWGYRNARSWHWSRDTITKPPKAKDHIVPHSEQEPFLSNKRGTVSFASGNPWVLQVFVNLDDQNVRLDAEHIHPFATLSDNSMKVIDQLYMGYKSSKGDIQALNDGTFLDQFPRASRIEHCQVVSTFTSASESVVGLGIL